MYILQEHLFGSDHGSGYMKVMTREYVSLDL